MNKFFIRRIGAVSKFDTDKDLGAFLETIDRYYTIAELRMMLIEKFGASRVPSNSTITRYLKKVVNEHLGEA